MVDISETVAEKLGLKVEWTEDTGWANFTESLRDARIDVFCGSLFRNAARGRYIGFSVPMFFAPVYGWVAENDHRFDYDYSIVDNPSVRVASIDGRISDIVAKKNFPKAKGFSIPGNSAVSDVFLNVATHKADIVFEPAFNAHGFMLANPKKLRLAQARPFLVFQSCLAVEIHETQLKEMLDSAIIELQDQGIIQQIVAKYSPADSGEYLRVALPYRD